MAPDSEVVEHAGLSLRDNASPLPIFRGKQMEEALTAYKELQRTLDDAMPDQIMDLEGKKFRKKGYWRAVAVAFNLSVKPTEERREVNSHFDDGRENFGWIVTYEASDRFGRSATGDGSCFAIEKARRFKCPHPESEGSRRTLHWPNETCPDFDPAYQWKTLPAQATEHNIRSHAHTRAFNRAVSNLCGFGEVSAEEVADDEKGSAETAKPAGSGKTEAAKPKAAVSADAVGKVKDVTKKTGTKNNKAWTRFLVTMEDGREGSTFDSKHADLAEEAKAKGLLVRAVFEQEGQFTNLKSIELATEASAPLPIEDTEPVGQPEKVLTVRSVTPAGSRPYWVVQTDRRQYVTFVDSQANWAEACRKDNLKVVVAFERKMSPKGTPYNEITKFEDAPAESEKPAESSEALA